MLIETRRLIIRSFTSKDLSDFTSIVANPEVMRFSLQGPLSQEQAKDYLDKRILNHYHQHGYGLWALVHKEEQKLIGFAGLITQIIDQESRVELGYRLLPAYWGRGLATEANEAISRYAFEQLGMDSLISIIEPANIRSLNAAKRIGMRLLKETIYHGIPVQIFELRYLIK